MHIFIKHYILITSLLIPCSVIASDTSANFNLTEIEQGNYVHLGQHVTIEDKQRDDIANIGFIIGDKCIAVIDTGGSIKTGQRLLTKIRSISRKPVCYVINTHIHYDHILGNKVFALANTRFIGHQNLAKDVERNRSFFLEQFKRDLGTEPDASVIIGPDLLIETSQQIELGNRTLTLIPYQLSHSHSDLVVIDNKTKTLWTGDLIFRERIPSLTGSIKGWVKVMKELQTLDAKKVVPGHGTVANSMTEAIQQQQTYLIQLLSETRKAIAAGKFLDDAVETIDKDNHLNWLLHEYQHPKNVTKAFTELEWE